MSNSTPGFVDPYKMSKTGQTLQGKVAVAAMPRANKLLTSDAGEVEYNLKFNVVEHGLCVIEGSLSANITMCCQRCLKEFKTTVSSKFLVGVVKNDQEAKELPDSYEPVFEVDNKIYPDELLEDELILAFPLVPAHDDGNNDCVVITTAEQEKRASANPFQVLQNLNINVDKKGH